MLNILFDLIGGLSLRSKENQRFSEPEANLNHFDHKTVSRFAYVVYHIFFGRASVFDRKKRKKSRFPEKRRKWD